MSFKEIQISDILRRQSSYQGSPNSPFYFFQIVIEQFSASTIGSDPRIVYALMITPDIHVTFTKLSGQNIEPHFDFMASILLYYKV